MVVNEFDQCHVTEDKNYIITLNSSFVLRNHCFATLYFVVKLRFCKSKKNCLQNKIRGSLSIVDDEAACGFSNLMTHSHLQSEVLYYKDRSETRGLCVDHEKFPNFLLFLD